MFLSATTLQLLMEKGINGADLVEVYAALEADWRSVEPLNSETAADRKKARDAARMAQKRAEERQSRDVASDYDDSPASPSFLPPRPPNQTTPTPPEVSTRTRGAADGVDFQRFWAAYPNKSAKDTARKAFANASKRCDLETMLAAIEAQRTWDQWQRGFVPHAASWLNAGRWQDEPPPTPVIINQAKPNVPGPDHKLAAKDANLARAFAGADAAAEYLAERRRSGF